MRRIILALSLFWLILAGQATAQSGPDWWQVTGVSGSDPLNIRSGAGTANRVVATAPNGAVLRNLGCRGSGNSRWCQIETPNGRIRGWVAGRFLRESGGPGSGSGGGTTASNVPELSVRDTGEIEVAFASGCTVLFNPAGRRIAAGSSCSGAQRSRAADAVASYRREQGSAPAPSTGGGSANVSLRGSGTIYGGAALTGSIFGHAEGAYALTISGGKLVCTGLLKHRPGSVRSEATQVHCTTGASGIATLARNRSGNGMTVAFTLGDGTGGYVLF